MESKKRERTTGGRNARESTTTKLLVYLYVYYTISSGRLILMYRVGRAVFMHGGRLAGAKLHHLSLEAVEMKRRDRRLAWVKIFSISPTGFLLGFVILRR